MFMAQRHHLSVTGCKVVPEDSRVFVALRPPFSTNAEQDAGRFRTAHITLE